MEGVLIDILQGLRQGHLGDGGVPAEGAVADALDLHAGDDLRNHDLRVGAVVAGDHAVGIPPEAGIVHADPQPGDSRRIQRNGADHIPEDICLNVLLQGRRILLPREQGQGHGQTPVVAEGGVQIQLVVGRLALLCPVPDLSGVVNAVAGPVEGLTAGRGGGLMGVGGGGGLEVHGAEELAALKDACPGAGAVCVAFPDAGEGDGDAGGGDRDAGVPFVDPEVVQHRPDVPQIQHVVDVGVILKIVAGETDPESGPFSHLGGAVVDQDLQSGHVFLVLGIEILLVDIPGVDLRRESGQGGLGLAPVGEHVHTGGDVVVGDGVDQIGLLVILKGQERDGPNAVAGGDRHPVLHRLHFHVCGTRDGKLGNVKGLLHQLQRPGVRGDGRFGIQRIDRGRLVHIGLVTAPGGGFPGAGGLTGAGGGFGALCFAAAGCQREDHGQCKKHRKETFQEAFLLPGASGLIRRWHRCIRHRCPPFRPRG